MKIGDKKEKDDEMEEEVVEEAVAEEENESETDKQEEYEDYNKNSGVVIEDYAAEEEGKKSFFDSSDRRKLVIIMGIIFLLFIIFLLLLYVASVLSKHTYTYEEVEGIMNQAAINYFAEHPEALPQTEGSAVEIDATNLAVALKMKNLSEYIENETCTGSVIVENVNSRYIYFPRLNCGNNYSSIELYKKVIDKGVVSSGYGLYSTNGSYVFRGENVNNFVQLNNNLWRIVKITSTNKIMLIRKAVKGEDTWDNRYNTILKENIGVNNYPNSRIKEYLDDISFSDETLRLMVPFNICVGKKSNKSTRNDNTEECQEVFRNQMVGLLTVSDYLYASVDPNCKNVFSKSCQNYNYLNGGVDVWLVTADKDSSYKAYCVLADGTVTLKNTNEMAFVRPVIYLNNKVLYKSGNGTIENPYTIK